MNHLICLPDGKWPLVLSCGALILTVGSLIAISVSLETAYMWLLLVLMATLFLTTFTCSPKRAQIIETEVEVSGQQPFWIVDLPPTYAHVIGSATPPPSYATIHHLPPKYEEIKIDFKDPNLTSTDLYRYTLSHQLDNMFHLPQRSSAHRASLASVHST